MLPTREGIGENFRRRLIGRVGEESLGVRLCFVQKQLQWAPEVVNWLSNPTSVIADDR